MKNKGMILGLLSIVSLTACGADYGYYDSNNVFHRYARPGNVESGTATPGGASDPRPVSRSSVHKEDGQVVYKTPDDNRAPYDFSGVGYYDYQGNIIYPTPISLIIPGHMMPPTGYCRVWFTNRLPLQQPSVQSCESIRAQVIPSDAYIVSGGR